MLGKQRGISLLTGNQVQAISLRKWTPDLGFPAPCVQQDTQHCPNSCCHIYPKEVERKGGVSEPFCSRICGTVQVCKDRGGPSSGDVQRAVQLYEQAFGEVYIFSHPFSIITNEKTDQI